MKFNIDRKEFVKGLNKLQAIAEKNSNTPILGSILIKRESADQISLFGTNLEISLSVPCAAEGVTEGRMAIEGRKLYEIVKELPDGPVTCALLENQLVQITAGKSKFKLQSYNPDDYPIQEVEKVEFQFEMTGKDFLGMVKKTCFAIGENDNRYVLNGMLAFYRREENGAGSVRFVGTDGHRLAVSGSLVSPPSNGAPPASPLEKKLIVPRKAVMEMKKLVSDSGVETLTLASGRSQLAATIGPLRFSARLLEGTYPDYSAILPKEFSKQVTFRKDEMVQAIQRVSILSNQNGKGVKLAIDPEKATLSSESENGQAEDQIPVMYEGPGIETGFNARYFLDVLSANENDELVMSMNDPLAPVSFKNPSDPNSLWVVMPMRI